jgi:hypothetical protein
MALRVRDIKHELPIWAVKNGDLDILKYAHQSGCKWDKSICAYAALNGHLECLKYAHQNGCPWDEITTTNATSNGYLDCLKYAYENGCNINLNLCNYIARKEDYEHCYDYIKQIQLEQNEKIKPNE